MSKRLAVYLGSAKVPGDVCPNCGKYMDGITRASYTDDRPIKPVTGAVTMCAYCGAILIFKNEQGEFRLPTDEERKSLAENQDLLARAIKDMSKDTATAFWTKTGMKGKA